jgi:WD40 repeat protein
MRAPRLSPSLLARGLHGLILGFALCTYARADVLPAQSLVPAGATHNRAQVLDWISASRFALGRWDGTVSLFRTPRDGEFGPVIEQAWSAESGRGIEMLVAADEHTLLVSEGAQQLALWQADRKGRFSRSASLSYDARFGTANSGLALGDGRQRWLATGHENGALLIWQRDKRDRFSLQASLDLKSPLPIAAKYPLGNIRDLVPWRTGQLIAGSEDGDIVGIDLASRRELFRQRYNPAAQRGVNDLAIAGDWLLVANCSVGSADSNLWLFDLSSGKPVLSDAANLVLDTLRPQVFNFDIELISRGGATRFFASTEEGLLWQGDIRDGQLVVTGVTRVAPDGGATLDSAPDQSLIAAAAYQILLFKAD